VSSKIESDSSDEYGYRTAAAVRNEAAAVLALANTLGLPENDVRQALADVHGRRSYAMCSVPPSLVRRAGLPVEGE
jgi:hypothetical protein